MKSVILYHSAELRQLLTQQLDQLDIEVLSSANNYQYGYDVIKNHLPDVVFVEITEVSTPNRDLIRRISLFEKNITLYGFTSQSNVSPTADWAYYGIRKILVLPEEAHLIPQLLEEQLQAWQSIHAAGGKVISVYSNKGGLGKTSISVNLAASIASLGNYSVALVDLNLQLGDVATFLDLNPRFTISDISKNIERLDEDYMKSSLEKVIFPKQNPVGSIYVLADPVSVEQCEEISADHINTIITLCKDFFDFVIVDLSSTLDNKTITAIDLSDSVLLVTLANLPSIKSANRVLSLFKQLAYPDEKIKIILNRYSKYDEITAEDIGEVLSKPVFAKVDNNYQLMCASINKGEPVMALDSGANVQQSFIALARMLAANLAKESALPLLQVKKSGSLITQVMQSITKKKP
jgi:pilus assembly protein CpaE